MHTRIGDNYCYPNPVELYGAYRDTWRVCKYRTYIEQVFEPLGFIDFVASLVKAIVFGFTIGIVGCYQGWYSNKGTEGVGKAANGAVVTAMFLVFIEEIIIVQITGWFR